MFLFLFKYGIWFVNFLSAYLVLDFFQYMKAWPFAPSIFNYLVGVFSANVIYIVLSWPESPKQAVRSQPQESKPVELKAARITPSGSAPLPIPSPAPVVQTVVPAPQPVVKVEPIVQPSVVDPLEAARKELLKTLRDRMKNLRAEENLQASFQMPFLNSWAKLSRWHDLGLRIGLQILDWLQSGSAHSLCLLVDGNPGTGKTEASQSLLGASIKGTPALELPGFEGNIVRFNSSNIKDFENKVSALQKRSVILIDETNLMVESSSRSVFNDSTRPQFLSQLQHFVEHTSHVWILFGDFQTTRGSQTLSDKSMKHLFGSTLGELIHHWQLQVPAWTLESLVDAILESNLVAADGAPFEPSTAEGFSLGHLAKICIETGGGYRECEKHIKNLVIQWKKEGKRGSISLEQVKAYLSVVMRDAA